MGFHICITHDVLYTSRRFQRTGYLAVGRSLHNTYMQCHLRCTMDRVVVVSAVVVVEVLALVVALAVVGGNGGCGGG